MKPKIIDFYLHNGTNASGKNFEQIVQFNPDQLERGHDYIQWLFPTITQSKCSATAPVLDDETIAVLVASDVFRERFTQALNVIFEFWGLTIKDLIVQTIENKEYFWSYFGDHNLLRMTRVIESCRLLGFESTAISFCHALLSFSIVNDGRTSASILYWYEAAYGNPYEKTLN